MDLLTRSNVMCTPKMAIDELRNMRGRERWYRKRLAAIERHLAKCYWRGIPLLDVPMNMASIDAVLKEAWHVVNDPNYRQREFEQVAADANAARGIH